MELNLDYLLNALPIMGKGMLGIFIVTGIIIVTVSLINRISGGDEK